MLNANYFETFQLGMIAQLKELNMEEVVLYVQNHLHSFLMDEDITFCFIERLANDPNTGQHEKAGKNLLYLLDKALQLRPFRPGLLDAVIKLTKNPQLIKRKAIIDQFNDSKETFDLISGLNLKQDHDDAKKFIADLLAVHPSHIAAAQFALGVDYYFGTAAGLWLEGFTCPPALRREWEISLFNHHASVCAYDEAMTLWSKLRTDMLRELSYNFAAEMFAAAGDTAQAIELYKKSIQMDPRQTPVRLRLKELENPFVPDDTLLDACSVNICLYSWNKAEILGQTLESLSESDIGSAKIDILLNGCTDNSREIVDALLPRFPNNTVTVHDLHVNIGAPAARNWLLRLPKVQESKYIAFLDDDVTVQKNWLASFLTVAETDEAIGVVGCKILHPGKPALIQYLFRYVAIADHGLLKMSIHAPSRQFDNNRYDFIRETRNVMGCLHLIRTEAMKNIGSGFDIRFSPSQVDDIDHDLSICLEGYKVMYCGLVTCIHHQSSGTNVVKNEYSPSRIGSIMGNDIKFYFKHCEQLERLKALDNISLDVGVEVPEI